MGRGGFILLSMHLFGLSRTCGQGPAFWVSPSGKAHCWVSDGSKVMMQQAPNALHLGRQEGWTKNGPTVYVMALAVH